VEIIDLVQVKEHLHSGPVYANDKAGLGAISEKINASEGLIVICPEYNGSMPGVLKYFIDHMKFPQAFEYRPVSFIGLGGLFGGLRPVEHLQQIFGYRNSFIYPERVFMMNVNKVVDAQGEVTDELMKQLLQKQAEGFQKFCKALSAHKLDANAYIEMKKQK